MQNISILFILLSSILLACNSDEQEVIIPDPPGIGEVRAITPTQLVAEMGIGWNLGNSFDTPFVDKTLWGNPLPSRSFIEDINELGFGTLRIPVTWGSNQQSTAPYTIEAGYLDDINEVVDWGFEFGMHVIINLHHDDDWVIPNAANAPIVEPRLESLWMQVANHFIEYNDSLIFETLNESRVVGSPEEWTGGTAAGRSFINDFQKTAVDAIRATGGNNERRKIMVSPYAAATIPFVMDDLVIPNNDANIIISLHSYFPWAFAGIATEPWGSDQDRIDLESELEKIYQKWVIEEGRAVILGEFGSIDISTESDDSNLLSERIDYTDFYVSNAKERGLLPIVWDNGGNFRLYDRNIETWAYRSLAETMVAAYE